MTGNIRVRLSALPHPRVFSDPARTIMAADRTALLTNDPDTRAGFIYRILDGVWLIHAPVDFVGFVVLARLQGYTINDSQDARLWLDTCSPHPNGENVTAFPQRKPN